MLVVSRVCFLYHPQYGLKAAGEQARDERAEGSAAGGGAGAGGIDGLGLMDGSANDEWPHGAERGGLFRQSSFL